MEKKERLSDLNKKLLGWLVEANNQYLVWSNRAAYVRGVDGLDDLAIQLFLTAQSFKMIVKTLREETSKKRTENVLRHSAHL